MKKILTFLAVCFCASAFLSAQRVGVLKGPSGIPCSWLMENSDKSVEFEVFASAQAELPKLLKGEIDIGFLPPNAAAKVFNAAGGKIVALGIAGNCNLFLLSKTDNLKLEDLNGKTIVCAGQGATPEYMLKFLLAKKGVKEYQLDFSIPNADIAAALVSGKCDYALVPEPFATVAQTKDSSVKRLDLQSVYEEVTGKKTFPMTLLVANAMWLTSHKKEAGAFVKQFKKASDWTVKNPEQAGALVEKHQLGLKAKVAEKAIPSCAYTWKTAKNGQNEIEEILNLFLTNSSEAVGGKLPEKNFYSF